MVDLHSCLTVRKANLKDFINCGHVVWESFVLAAPLFLPELHIKAIEQFRMDILYTFGMTDRPLFKGLHKIRTNLDCPLQKHWLSAVQAFFDTVAGEQKVQDHLSVLLLVVDIAQKIPHPSSVGADTRFPHTPSGLFDQVHEEEGLGVTQQEESGEVFEYLQQGESSKDFCMAGQVAKYGKNIGHFLPFIELGSLVSVSYCCCL